MTTRSAKSRGFRLGEYWHWLGRRAREIAGTSNHKARNNVAGNDDAAQGGVLGWGHCGDQGSRDLARSRKKRKQTWIAFSEGISLSPHDSADGPTAWKVSSRLVHFPLLPITDFDLRELMPLIFASH